MTSVYRKQHITGAGALILLFLVAAFKPAHSSQHVELKNLNIRTNNQLRELRSHVRKSLYTIKSGRDAAELPDLTFYRYRVKKSDSFWSILSSTSMDMDTLLSVNDLASPQDIKKGSVIYIPNMRGVIAKERAVLSVRKTIRTCGIDPKYVYRANKTDSLKKKYLFIPCGRVSSLQRSLFLGTAFLHPTGLGRRSSGFGTRIDPFNKHGFEFHSGIDIACPVNTRVRAARKGSVVFCGHRGGYGKLIVIRHEHGYKTYYGHLNRSLVKKGQAVGSGDIIALSGNTGRTTGPHLHFEIRRAGKAVNPALMIHQ